MLRLPTNKKQTMLNGAITLVITTLIVKVIGVLYKIPLTAMLGEVGLGYFSSAYDVYTPIVSISMAGIPIAVAKMVSQDVALHRYRNARQTYRVSFRLFIIIGVVGTAVMLLLAYPYAFWISKSPNTFYSILAISPAVFFCCAMSIYRGYYEGLSNMVPTGVSQVIEALGKLVLGLLLSYGVIRAGKAQFASGGVVFGKAVQNMDEAMAEIYPYAAAAAVMGVTIGTMIGFFYLLLRYKVKGDGFTRTDLVNSPKPLSGQEIAKMMIALAIPVVASSLITNVTNIIDAGMLRARLASIMNDPAAAGIMKSMYAESLLGTGTPDDSVTDYLYGCYSAAINFKNLVPMITMNFGVSALPVLSAAWATKDHKTSRVTIESVLRLTLLIGLPAGIGMAVLAKPILMLLYGSRPYLVPVAVPIMQAYGYSTALMALSAPITNMLQAIGRTDVPVKSLLIGAAIKDCGQLCAGWHPLNQYPGRAVCVDFMLCCRGCNQLVFPASCLESAYQCNLRFLEAGILLSGVRRGGFCKLWHPEYVARQHLACGRPVRQEHAQRRQYVCADCGYDCRSVLCGGAAIQPRDFKG